MFETAVAAFVGAWALPRLGWVLLTLASLGAAVPVAMVVILLVYLHTHLIHIG